MVPPVGLPKSLPAASTNFFCTIHPGVPAISPSNQ